MADNIIFVIIDPTQKEQPALVRATDIAKHMGGHLHIFCSDYIDEAAMGKFKSKKDAKKQTLDKAKALVETLVAPLKKDKIPLSTEVIWNKGWYQAAVHASARKGADLIIKSSYSHKGSQHPLDERSDFYLIRNSTCPVLLTKSGQSHKLERVLAAVTLESGKHNHDSLNNRIVSQARKICRLAGAELHLVAALVDNPDITGLLKSFIDEEKGIRTERDLIAARFDADPEQVHVGKGKAKNVIIEKARELDTQALVLGTKARKGIKGALLGNTAEKVLDQVEIDVLIIN